MKASAVRLHVQESGSGPLVILLHGFPEFSYSWRQLLPALASAGFHAVAPDLRGYNLSDKPRGVSSYAIDELVSDVARLIEERGAARAAVVGHDWGGIIAWRLAMMRPDLLDRLVILNAPHPAAYRRAITRTTQLLRSWYVLVFQLPWLPERWLAANDFASIRGILRDGAARAGVFTEFDIGRYVEAAARPGALTAMLNYYRAAVRRPGRTLRASARVTAPTLVIWGMRDRFLDASLADGLERWVDDVRVERLPEATHWVQHDEPARVAELIVAFLRLRR
ncbi:MAG: alpha/beta fold hydrolase [Gemmatimonadaceae bacterium]